ncbi:MAG: Conserved hypothetical membrane protein, DUF6 family [Candidatus Woesebacteria bacterium GW2011_GWA1_39_8]|jgi:uncharacterized membrane protein|uniref:Conserved hypothetical membrane protein, DUF6 family n=1 Tax=Candidatus Woesebacteria bacterium GW2011_GWA1_39_8 TaxID=1618552 RepID=A0A0G0SWF6_9BACT|nr:MAG: Conserved hypothetical membrane protein, DUF6 family [Candidatus Woesebacteria bacterium GW2011_GWA1_39_8]
MEWLSYALLGPALFGINNLIDKFILDKHIRGLGAFTIVYGIVSFVMSVLLFVFIGFHFLDIKSSFFILSAGAIQIITFLTYFKSLTLDEASRVTPLFQFIPVFSLILAALLLGEVLKPFHLLGFVIIFIGGFLLSGKNIDKKVFTPRPAFWFMLVASLGSASLGIIFKFVYGLNTFWQTIAWEHLGIGIASFFLFLIPSYKKQFISSIKNLNKFVYGAVLINELVFFLGRLSLRYAFTMASVALVTVLMGTQPLFVLGYTIVLTMVTPQIIKEDIEVRVVMRKFMLMLLILLGVYSITL